MPDIASIQSALQVARKNVSEAQRNAALAGGEHSHALSYLEKQRRLGNKDDIAAAEQAVAQSDAKRAAAEESLDNLKTSVSGLLKELEMLDPATLIEGFQQDISIALLPVRIETRYFNIDTPQPELRIRIYPDDIHVDSHEPELTETEAAWGRVYWESTWRAADDTARASNVWMILVNQAGLERAAWIRQLLSPTNPDDRPQSPIAEDGPLPVEPVFPEPDIKGDTWTRAAVTRVMPDRWVAIGYQDDNKVFTTWGKPVPDALHVSLGPDSLEPAPAELPVDDRVRWMVDFDEAENLGMGIRVLFQSGAKLDLQKLLVLGVKVSADHEQGADMLSDLLDAHQYTDGLSIIRQGTPTNNSSEQTSGYEAREARAVAAFKDKCGNALFELGDGSDGDRLTAFLGIPRQSGSSKPEVFAYVNNAPGRENDDAHHMNCALFTATFGYYLRVMMEGVLSEEAIKRTHRHFIDYVHGRGPLSAIRIGRQPYGILPSFSLSLWEPISLTGDDFEQHLLDFLIKLRAVWNDTLALVPRIGRTADIDQDLIDCLGQDAISLNYASPRGNRQGLFQGNLVIPQRSHR